MEYWHNYDAGWATTDLPWYIVCTMNGNGNFVLDNSSLTSFLTQTLPTSDDGKFYIMGGWMHNNHDQYRLQIDHPIYVYKNGAVRMYSGYADTQNGHLQGYKDYELLLDFGSDAAGSDRRIVSTASPSQSYSTIGFTIEIIDVNANHARLESADDVCKETYYVHCVRQNSTTANDPDRVYVNGPGSKIQGLKVSQGNYEILLRNDALYREYRVSIKVHAVNGSHTVNYHNGDTPSSGTNYAPTTSKT